LLATETTTEATGGRRFARGASASGHRLLAAFARLEQMPALADARANLRSLLADGAADEQIVLAIEADAALTAAVLRAAAKRRGGAVEPADPGVAAAVLGLSRPELAGVAQAVPTFDFFDRSHTLAEHAGRLRAHALATQRAAYGIREELAVGVSGQLAAAALLHDIGKIVLTLAYDNYDEVLAVSAAPEQRLLFERRALGIDHASAGGVLLRRLGVPGQIAFLVENHHAERADGDVAILRLADMLAHHAADRPVDARELTRLAGRVGLSDPALRRALADPSFGSAPRRTKLRPSPLSRRQLTILGLLGRGLSYKQISAELGVSLSTVRTHTHRAYKVLGVADRAQAVLLATREGWL
jgi:putative nucleotidyltransferase with HDIG domain